MNDSRRNSNILNLASSGDCSNKKYKEKKIQAQAIVGQIQKLNYQEMEMEEKPIGGSAVREQEFDEKPIGCGNKKIDFTDAYPPGKDNKIEYAYEYYI